jgi:catechol 2,3-dioxygenase-like lactoylglutathione lyase family enzyme
MRFSCAMLYVKDLPRMRAFYSQLFGANAVNTKWTDTWARFDAGGTSFALHAIPPDIAREVQASPVPREKSPAKFIFEVDDVAGERRRLESLEIRTIQRPWQDPAESFEAVDPEGNIFQVSTRIRDQI